MDCDHDAQITQYGLVAEEVARSVGGIRGQRRWHKIVPGPYAIEDHQRAASLRATVCRVYAKPMHRPLALSVITCIECDR